MAKKRALCEDVKDGDTFRTADGLWIRLAKVKAPKPGTTVGKHYKDLLEELIMNEPITYEKVGMSHNKIVADVWVGDLSVNDYMLNMVYW